MLSARDEVQRIYAAAGVRLLLPDKKERQTLSVGSAPRLMLIVLAVLSQTACCRPPLVICRFSRARPLPADARTFTTIA